MAEPCADCGVLLSCADQDPLFLYSLQSELFPFVFFCPPGYRCDTASEFRMVCCNRELAVSIPGDADGAERLLLIQGVLGQCSRLLLFCNNRTGGGSPVGFPGGSPGGFPGGFPPSIPGPGGAPGGGGGGSPGAPKAQNGYYNEPQVCVVNCPDGSPYVHTVQAGIFFASTLAEANQQAKARACSEAAVHKLCLGKLTDKWCDDEPYSSTPSVSGSFVTSGATWSVSGGSLPTGLTLDSSTGEISGTPSAVGAYNFTLQVAIPNGDVTYKQYTITIVGITTDTLPEGTIDEPYSASLTASGMAAPLGWAIVAGGLPSGLELDEDSGLISGTPGSSGDTTFTAGVADADGVACTKELSIHVKPGICELVWSMFSQELGDPAGTITAVGVDQTGTVEAEVVVPVATIVALSFDFRGTCQYTGPEIECNVTAVMSGTPGASVTAVTIFVGGSTPVQTFASGTFPFTIPESLSPIDIVILLGGSLGAGSPGTFQLNMVGTISTI